MKVPSATNRRCPPLRNENILSYESALSHESALSRYKLSPITTHSSIIGRDLLPSPPLYLYVRTFRSGISAFPACLWSPGVHTIHPYPNSPGPGNLTPLTLFRFADNICADTEFPSTSKFGSPRYGHGFKPGCTKESRSSFPAYHSQASTRCAESGSYLSTSPKLSYVLLIRLQIDYNATRHDFGLHQYPNRGSIAIPQIKKGVRLQLL
jgi:hypothetical protein